MSKLDEVVHLHPDEKLKSVQKELLRAKVSDNQDTCMIKCFEVIKQADEFSTKRD